MAQTTRGVLCCATSFRAATGNSQTPLRNSVDSPLMHDLVLSDSAPTRTRYLVLAFLCALAFVLYLDRICISTAAPSITKDLGLSDTEMGFVFSAFSLAYGLF